MRLVHTCRLPSRKSRGVVRGNVRVVEIDGPVVRLELEGACGSCPSSTMTMKMGLERRLVQRIPEISEVVQSIAELGYQPSPALPGAEAAGAEDERRTALRRLIVAGLGAMQVMMLAESVNRIWGRTRNPWNLNRSPGGSSGGDAALVAMGCVPLSACADGAGSIRIPASFQGVVGFKVRK